MHLKDDELTTELAGPDVTVVPGRSWQDLTISLTDGQEIQLEARGAAHQLAAEFGKLTPGG